MTQDVSAQQQLKAALQASQNWWADMGIEVPAALPAPKRAAVQKQAPKLSTQTSKQTITSEKSELVDSIARAKAIAKAAPTLEALKQAIKDFEFSSLSDYAQNMVFSRGNPKARVMVIGEAPGKKEDETGKPFVGPAGQLLDKMFAAIQMDENSLYITNVCNWRPPSSRNPNEDELAVCAPFITRHIELVTPEVIVIVGGLSLQALTGKTGIMKARGQWQELAINGNGIPAMPLYHPAFLLRRPELKKYAWRDLLAIKEKLAQL